MAKAPFTEHPKFTKAAAAANDALGVALDKMGLKKSLYSNDLEAHANRVVDDMTRLLLRAFDAENKAT